MAGISFNVGETKTRPGIYTRYEQQATPLYAGATDGVVACAFTADWGPLNEVTRISTLAEAQQAFGFAGNTSIFTQIFTGGASTLLAVRVGNGGTAATATLKDAEDIVAVNITAKHKGARTFKFEFTSTTGDASTKEFVLSENGRVLEKILIPAGEAETQALIQRGANSQYLDFARASGYTGGAALATVSEQAFTAGTQPTATKTDYNAAFLKLQPHQWNCVCIDSSDAELHAALLEFMRAAYRDGHTGFCVVGEPITADLDTRKQHAAAINSYLCIYVGGGFNLASAVLIDGWLAAARVAAMVASVSSAHSLTRRSISGAVAPAELLTNSQYEACTNSGLLTFSQPQSGGTWIENAITTLVNPEGEDDSGWKKIKRSRIRFELMERTYATVNPLIGSVSNDEDGRAAVIQAVQRVLLAMVKEGKLYAGAVIYEDETNAPTGDSAYFIIEADDIDALEKVYFTYTFSFAQAA